MIGIFYYTLTSANWIFTVHVLQNTSFRASHCFDMQGWLPSDTIKMTFTKQEARRIVASWLSNRKKH